MSKIQATNDFVFIIRNEVLKEKAGLILPSASKVKPHKGIIFSVGGKSTDPEIRRGVGKTAMFHQGVGFTIEEEGQDYLIVRESEIIAVI